MPFKPGDKLDKRYELLRELGKGGMGIVYCAKDLTLDREVAIKILRREMLDSQSRERLRREARAAAKLSHPGIVVIHDVVLSEESAYLVMEFLKGESLRTWQDRVDLSWPDLIQIAMQLTSALAYSHEAGIVHRDMKPENVMISAQQGAGPDEFPFHATLLDFGLAKPFDASRLTQSGAFVGTASYMSPEQISGGTLDGRSDVYSLGVMLYELVCKRRPFEGDSFQNILYRHIHERPRPLSKLNPGVHPALEAIILKALEKEPASRFSSAEEMHFELSKVLRMMMQEGGDLVASSLASVPVSKQRAADPMFVGRSEELRELRLRYQMAQMGQSQLLLVSGEAGMGKSRLVAELCRQSLDSGALVLRGRFYEQSKSFPYQGFIELLEDHFRALKEQVGRGGDPLHAYRDLTVDLARLSPTLAELLDAPTEAPERADLPFIFETFARVFIKMALAQPLVVVIEDLHWTDLPVDLLGFLCRRTSGFRILYVGTYRPEALRESHPLRKLIGSMTGERTFRLMKLDPLTPRDTQELVRGSLAAGGRVDELARRIYEITEGNPFFINEMMKSLMEKVEGSQEGGGKLVSRLVNLVGEASLPATVREVVMERFKRLPEDLRDILLQASVIGRWFEFEVLLAVTRADEDDLMRYLEKAILAGILIEEPHAKGERLHFASALMREALYRSLAGRRRRILHERVAEALEAFGVLGDPAAIFALAHHYVQAAISDKAITYCIRAGELARLQASLEDAEGFFLTAKDFLDEEDHKKADSRPLEVVRALGDVYRERGELSKATMTLRELLTRLEAKGQSGEAAMLCLDLGKVYAEARRPGKAKEFAMRGIDLVGEAEPSETLYRLYRLKADVASLEGEHRQAEILHKKAEKIARGLQALRKFKQGGALRMAFRDRLRTLDPHLSPLQLDASVMANIWEPLVSYGYGTDLVPRLAERWDISADARVYHIHLKEGVRFHDGSPMDAEDVLLSFMRAIRPGTKFQGYRLLQPVLGAKQYHQGKSSSIEGIRILDQTTIEIEMEVPLPFFLSILTSVNLAILPKSMWDEDEILPIGTGPFLAEDYVPSRKLQLKRHSYYHRPGFPNVERVTMELSVPPAERVSRFLEGEIDLLTDTVLEELRAMGEAGSMRKILRREVTSLATNYLLVQKRFSPFNDVRVRQALALAVDRQALKAAWEKGLAIPATTLLPPDLLGYEHRERALRPNLTRARKLLAEAGYSGGFETELSVRRGSSLARPALLKGLSEELGALGVTLKINALPDDEYASVVREGDSPLLLQGWVADYPDPDAFFHSLFMSGVGQGSAFLSSPDLDAVVARARQELSQDKRRQLYRRAEEIVCMDACFVPLSHDREVVYFHPRLRGMMLRLMAPHVELDRLWVQEGGSA